LHLVPLLRQETRRVFGAIIVVDKAPQQGSAALTDQLVSYFMERSVVTYPAVFTTSEWAKLGKSNNLRQHMSLLSPRTRREQILAYYRERKAFPTAFRRYLVSSFREYASFLDLMQREAPLSFTLTIASTESVVWEAFELLLASQGRSFDSPTTGVTSFRECFAAQPYFSATAATLPLRIGGLARQAHWLRALGNGEDETTGADHLQSQWVALAQELQQFFRGAILYAKAHFTSASERAGYKRNRKIAGAAGVVALCALGLWAYLSTRPLEGLTDLSAITRPGGIVGSYYRDPTFHTRVFTRSDPTPSLDTGRTSPDPRIPNDHFSVRWSGYLRFTAGGRRTLCVRVDDDARVFVAGQKIISHNGRDRHGRQSCSTIRVKENSWYPLRVDFVEHGGRAFVRLYEGEDETSKHLLLAKDVCCKGARASAPSKPAAKPSPQPSSTQPPAPAKPN